MATHAIDHVKIYKKVWGALLVLTTLTVAISYVEFGVFNIFVAMFIATVKATIVCLYFMHMIDDNRLNQVVFLSSFVFLFIFIALTLSDVLTRPSVQAVNALANL